MARERKSLVEQVLPGAGNDVLSRIIANDRERRYRDDLSRSNGEVPHASTVPASGDGAPIHAGSALDPVREELSQADDGGYTGNERTNVTTLQRTNVTTLQATEQSENAGPDAAPPHRRRRGTPAPGVDARATTLVDADVRAERLSKALSLAAADEVAVVTVRISTKLNEYMDRYVDRLNRVSPKRRYRKQDAVAEAFAAFFADHPLPPTPAEEEL